MFIKKLHHPECKATDKALKESAFWARQNSGGAHY